MCVCVCVYGFDFGEWLVQEVASEEKGRIGKEPMPTMPSSQNGCTATYSMNLTDHEARVSITNYYQNLFQLPGAQSPGEWTPGCPHIFLFSCAFVISDGRSG